MTTPYAPEEQKTTRSTATTRASAESKRTLGEDAVPAPGHSRSHLPADYRQINGWGVDLDPKNRPAYPKEWPSDVKTARGDVKHWQEPEERVHMSNEHPDLTPVFGTSCPPRGLSGLMRDYAYQFGEGTNRHWMTLLLADRVDIWESMLTDALRGHPDNYVREKGWPVRMRYSNPSRAKRQQYMFVGALALGALALTLYGKRNR